jgi:putative hemolysin
MEIFILIVLILLTAFFVVSEIALVSARKSRLEAMAAKGDDKAKTALDLANNPEKFLSTATIGITVVSILVGVFAEDKFSEMLKPVFEKYAFTAKHAGTIATIVTVIGVTLLTIVFGELMPKKIGLIRAEKIARVIAIPMNALSVMVHPLVWFLTAVTNGILKLFNIKKPTDSAVTEEEIKAIISEGSEHGAIEEEEKDIIERVFHLGDRNITSLMTHRTDITWFDGSETVQQAKDKMKEVVYSSYPVCNETVDNIQGIVSVKDLLKAAPDVLLKNIAKPALFVPENNSAYQLLEKFKEKQNHSCFIVNEYGTLDGMITLNDILEAIVGDVPQTGQDEYEIVQRADGTFLVDAQIPFYDFLTRFEKTEWMNEDEHDFDTIAGFVLHELEHIPNAGETFDWRGFSFEIIDMDGQRIDKLLVKVSDDIREEMENG